MANHGHRYDEEGSGEMLPRAIHFLWHPYSQPKDIRFRKKYYGSQRDRDLAYHNGSVWAWLLGPFCGLYVKVYKDEKSPRELALALGDFIGTLRKGFMKGHIASVAEVWDGDAPHFPKGAPAQAWSVAALYNIESYIDSLGVEP
jgi:glycogen debranching enzyme